MSPISPLASLAQRTITAMGAKASGRSVELYAKPSNTVLPIVNPLA